VREILWASDVFAMPSLNEGLGVAALEAMASGLPVIASDVGGLHQVIEDDRSGILVSPANPEKTRVGDWPLGGITGAEIADERGGADSCGGKLLDANDGSADARALSRVCEKNAGEEGHR